MTSEAGGSWDKWENGIKMFTQRLPVWADDFLGDIPNEEAFHSDVLRKAFDFYLDTREYKKARKLVEQHKTINYIDELDRAVKYCTEINETVFHITMSPIFEGDDINEIETNRKRLFELSQFLMSKQIQLSNSKIQELVSTNKCLDALETLRKWAFVEINGKLRWDSLDMNDQLFIVLGFEYFESEFTQTLERFKERYTFRSNAKKSEIRRAFVTGLASVYMHHTGRKTLKRSSKEIAQRRENSFSKLVTICFDSFGENVGKESLK